jgi:penicillin-binding protein 1C
MRNWGKAVVTATSSARGTARSWNALRQIVRPPRRPSDYVLIAVLVLASPWVLFAALDWLFPFPWQALERPPALVVADRNGEPLRFFLPPDQRWRLPVRLSELPPELPRALVASEDRRFYRHFGVDPLAVLRAAWTDLRAGAVVSGASTIPMQVARLAEPHRRGVGGKLRECFRAFQLERRYSKRRLLELYLNLTPYGGNIEGVGAAAWFYFGKTADRLSLGEIALLTALPRSPVRYDPTTHPQAARAARDRVLRQLAQHGYLDPADPGDGGGHGAPGIRGGHGAPGVRGRSELSRYAARATGDPGDPREQRGGFPPHEIEEALRQPVPAARHRPPFAAPHFSELVLRRFPGRQRLVTTLDRDLQRAAEELVRRRIPELRAQGIGNAAVVVVESSTRAVRALVGSAGFEEDAYQGQVDGAVARRSPGSTLKPFLYAMAMDGGRVLPDSYLLDIPTDFGGYVAENFDQRYRGRVTVRDALIHSYNACAVRLLNEVGLPEFHRLLRRGGLATLDRASEHYGLPLILGSGEVTLLDLTNLYATLAQEGVYAPVRLLAGAPDRAALAPRWEPAGAAWQRGAAAGERLFSPESAAAVAGILTELRRPDLPESWNLARGVAGVAWKTGTSYGHRDAWAVGFSGRFTIGVWVGNFDGRARLGISGSEHAAPLLFDLFRAMPEPAAPTTRERAAEAAEIEVCELSHELPGPYCPRRVRIPYLPGRSHLAACTYHRRVLVDAETGGLLSGDCLASRPHRFVLLTLFPAELVAWWRAQGTPIVETPRPALGCAAIPDGEAPHIVSPAAATAYRLRRDAPAEYQKIPLIAQAGAGTGHLFWYQDGVLVASSPPGRSLFLAERPGEHRLVVTDDSGRSDGITYRVE